MTCLTKLGLPQRSRRRRTSKQPSLPRCPTANPRSRARRGRATATLVATLLAAVAPEAWPSPLPSGRVVLLEAPASALVARRCLTRIRAELLADGFEVSFVDPGRERDRISIARVMERQQEAVAVIALIGPPEQVGAELWLLDRVEGSPQLRRVPVPTHDPDLVPEVLAIRSAEMLNASALKLLLEPRYPAKPQIPPVTRAASGGPTAQSLNAGSADLWADGGDAASPSVPRDDAAAPGPPSPTPSPIGLRSVPSAPHDDAAGPHPAASTRLALAFALEAGVSMLDSVGGPGPAAVPLLAARIRLRPMLFLRAAIAGLGSRPRVDTGVGSALVSQTFAVGELGIDLRPGRRWRPLLTAGGGALCVHGDGEGVWPQQGLAASQCSGVVEGGIGVLVHVRDAVALDLEARGLLALPHPTLRFDGVEAASVAYPALLASLSVVAWL